MSTNYIPKQPGMAIDPAKRAFSVTPNDTTEITVGRGIYVGTGGDLNVVMANDLSNTAVLFTNVGSGTLLPLEVRIVKNTSTTASDIVVVY